MNSITTKNVKKYNSLPQKKSQMVQMKEEKLKQITTDKEQKNKDKIINIMILNTTIFINMVNFHVLNHSIKMQRQLEWILKERYTAVY